MSHCKRVGTEDDFHGNKSHLHEGLESTEHDAGEHPSRCREVRVAGVSGKKQGMSPEWLAGN